MSTAFISQQAPGTATLVAGVASRFIVIDSIILSCGGAAGTAVLNTSTGPVAITPVFNLALNSNVVIDLKVPGSSQGVKSLSGDGVTLTTAGGSSTISCLVTYHLELA